MENLQANYKLTKIVTTVRVRCHSVFVYNCMYEGSFIILSAKLCTTEHGHQNKTEGELAKREGKNVTVQRACTTAAVS